MFRDNTPNLEKIIVWDTKGLREFDDPMVISFDTLLEMGDKADKAAPGEFEKGMDQVNEEDISVLIYTSGTTGPPKGAMLTHKNVTWTARAITANNPVQKEDEVPELSAPVPYF